MKFSPGRTGIVFHLFSRVFVAIAAIAVLVPIVYLPIYKERVIQIVASQGETLASTLIAVKGDDLYLGDYTSVIDYTQSVLNNTPDITSIHIYKRDADSIEITTGSWRFTTDYVPFNLPPGDTNVQRSEVRSRSSFAFTTPIVISNLEWGELQIRISGAEYDSLMQDYYFNYLVFAVIIIFGVLGLMLVSARPIVAQLNHLRDSTHRLAGGDLMTRAKPGGIGELEALSESFNVMAEALQHQTDRTQQLASVVEESSEGILMFDGNFLPIFENRAVTAILRSDGHQTPRTLEETLRLCGIAQPAQLIDRLQRVGSLSEDSSIVVGEHRIHIELRVQAISAGGQDDTNYVLSINDISARKGLEERLNELAYFDKLTGLSNRRHFLSALDTALERSEDFIVLFMDLDNFKFVNDSLGHEAGDHVLTITAKRLAQCLRAGDILARLGGDEFTAILTGDLNEGALRDLCDRIIKSVSGSIRYQGRNMQVGLSMGAVRVPTDAATVPEILKSADIAMYHTKQNGKMGYSLYEHRMTKQFVAAVDAAEMAKTSLANKTLAIAYQPIVDKHDQLFGMEALVRWPDHDGSPAELVRLLEAANRISELDHWVLEHALAQMQTWTQWRSDLTMSVNLSGQTVNRRGAADTIIQRIREAAVNPQHVQLEVTETIFIAHDQTAITNLRALREFGCRIALDDFGRGYSSLSYLYAFDIDTLKIDREIVTQAASNPKAAILVESIFDLASQLNLHTVAEGIETAREAEWVRSMGCDALQGYFYGKPVPASEFERAWLDPNGPVAAPAFRRIDGRRASAG